MTLDTVKMNRFTLAFDDAGLERGDSISAPRCAGVCARSSSW